MSFKSISLNRDKIEGCIKSFSEDAKVTGPITKPNNLFIYLILIPNQVEATLNVYYNKDGSTSITVATGKNHELSEKIALHVVGGCEYKNVPDKSLYIRKMTDDEFGTLLEYLKDYDAVIEDGSNLQHGKQLKVSSQDGGYIYLNRYSNGSFQVQGPSKIVKSWVIEGLTNLLPYKDVITIQLESLHVEVSSDKVLDQLRHSIPSAYDYLGNTLLAIISPSIALQSFDVDLKDYSAFAFPALKGLEGYIKKLFLEKGITIAAEGFGEFFERSSRVRLNDDTRNTINNPKVIRAIEDSYSYFKRQRHGLFHVDGLIETTRILDSKAEAEEIIQEVFNVIERSYANIVQQ